MNYKNIIINPSNLSTTIVYLLIFVLFACTNSDVVEPVREQQKSISFVGSMQKEAAVTRAEKGLEEVLDNKTFKVWAYKNTTISGDDFTDYQVVMPGYTVNYETGTGSDSNTRDWEYVGKGTNQYIKYWDYSACAYRFFAYAIGNATADPATEPSAVSVNETDDTKVTFGAAVDASNEATIEAAPYFSELWFSNDKVNDYGKPVTLRFLKPFARVRFLFKFIEGFVFGRESLSKIKFYPTPTSGTTPTITTAGNVSVSYPLKGTETKESWSVVSTGDIEAFTIDWYTEPDPADIPAGVPADALPTTWPNTPEKWYYVLPALAQGSYTVEVAIVSDDIKTGIVPAEYMSWKPGYEYTYVFKITEGGITIDVVQVAIKNWETTPIDRPIFNW